MAIYSYVGAISEKIILNTKSDISTATVRRIYYVKPDGTEGYWTATEESATSISFTTTVATDLNIDGIWILRSYIVTPTWTDYGDPVQYLVKETI